MSSNPAAAPIPTMYRAIRCDICSSTAMAAIRHGARCHRLSSPAPWPLRADRDGVQAGLRRETHRRRTRHEHDLVSRVVRGGANGSIGMTWL
jgi:hypothetical protein